MPYDDFPTPQQLLKQITYTSYAEFRIDESGGQSTERLLLAELSVLVDFAAFTTSQRTPAPGCPASDFDYFVARSATVREAPPAPSPPPTLVTGAQTSNMEPLPPAPHSIASNPNPRWVLYTVLAIQILTGWLSFIFTVLLGLFSPLMCDNGCSNETALTASSVLVVPAVTALVCVSACVATTILWRKLSNGSAIVAAVTLTVAYPIALLAIWWVLGTIIFNLFDGS